MTSMTTRRSSEKVDNASATSVLVRWPSANQKEAHMQELSNWLTIRQHVSINATRQVSAETTEKVTPIQRQTRPLFESRNAKRVNQCLPVVRPNARTMSDTTFFGRSTPDATLTALLNSAAKHGRITALQPSTCFNFKTSS